jgi:hypothetical protein
VVIDLEELKLFVLGYTPYKFKDKDSEKIISGISVWFIEEKAQFDDYGVGFLPRKVTMPYAFKDKLEKLTYPFQADPVMATRFTAKGAIAVMTDLNFICGVKFGLDKR